MDLTKIIASLTGNNLIGQISKNLNLDSSKIISVIKAAIPKFLARMQQNASSADGAASLTQALSNHAGQSLGIDLEDGMKILGKIFGGNLNSVVSNLSSQTSTTNDQVSNILASIAPNLLSVLGQGNAGGNIGNLLGSLLGGGSSSSNAGTAGKLLGGLLGKMFKKK